MSQKEVQVTKIIFLTHPSWPIIVSSISKTDKFYRRTPTQIMNYFEKEVLPRILAAGKGTIVVFVKNIPDLGSLFRMEARKMQREGEGTLTREHRQFLNSQLREMTAHRRRENKESATRERKARGVEKIIEKRLRSIVGNRLMIATGAEFGYTELGIAKEVNKWAWLNKIRLAPKVNILGMGAWASQCAHNYPRNYANMLRGISNSSVGFKLIKKATIPIKQRGGNFKTLVHLHAPGK